MQAQLEIISVFKYRRIFYSLPLFLEAAKKFGQKFSEEKYCRTQSALRTPSQEAGRQTIKKKAFQQETITHFRSCEAVPGSCCTQAEHKYIST